MQITEQNLGFVVLNYNGCKITCDCIDSLIKYYPKSYICIVDNDSKDDSVVKLKNKYNKNSNILILKAEKNYGFAVGNNIGINYLKDLGLKFIVVINNDTIFQQSGIINYISNLDDSKKNIGIVSLELCNRDNTKQLPYGLIKSAYKNYIKIGLINFLLFTKIYFVLRFIKRLFVKNKKDKLLNVDYNNYNYVISGAAYILTPNFFDNYAQLFNKTFLYCEEHILAIYLQKAKLKTDVFKDTRIIHLESQTAKLKPLSYKKLLKAISSWFKGFKLLFLSKKKICKKYSNKNYNFMEIKKGEEL